jgi:predicted RNase H-like HicB family nuclease
VAVGEGGACSVSAPPDRLDGEASGWLAPRSRTPGFPNFVFSFHESEEIGPRMLARVASGQDFAPTICSAPAKLRPMKLPVILDRDETGMIVAQCPAIPGCVSQGLTEDEAIANIREAIIGCLEARAEQGMPLTVRTVEVDVAVA